MRDWHRKIIVGFTLAALAGALSSCDLAKGDDTAPSRVADLFYFFDADGLLFNGRVSAGTQTPPGNTRLLAWTTPGDDNNDGEAALYDLRYVRSTDIPAGVDGAGWLLSNFDDARELSNEPYPTDAGKLQQLLLPRLYMNDTIWFALRTFDEIGNESKTSDVAGPIKVNPLSLTLHGSTAAPVPDFGAPVGRAYDFNGDGSMDWIIGSPAQDRACLFLGQLNNALVTLRPNAAGIWVYQTIAEMLPRATYQGTAGEGFGAAVAGVGGINVDTYQDVAIGAPLADSGAGRVYIDYGHAIIGSYTISGDSLPLRLGGESAGDGFGSAVAPLGDQNADTYQEVMVGAPGALSGAGKFYVFSGPALGTGTKDAASAALVEVWGEQAGDGLGQVVAPIGDVNGDGIPDLAVGAPGYDDGATADCGAVYIFYGGSGFFYGHTVDLAATPADVKIVGTSAGRHLGSAISGGGNLGGDAGSDFTVVGGSTVYVFIGGQAGFPVFPLASAGLTYHDSDALTELSIPGVEFGAAIAAEQDLDQNNFADIIVGAPGEPRTYIYFGPVTAATAGADFGLALDGPAGYGRGVASVGDVSGDGYNDFVVGAPDSGAAYLTF